MSSSFFARPITIGGRTGWTLRCYLGDDPVFLSTDHRIHVFASPAALEDYIAELERSRLPVPSRLRTEVRLHRGLFPR